MYSLAEENFLKAILHLVENQKTATTNALAKRLSMKPASVSDMLKRLAEKKLVKYEPYKGATLTHSGKHVAISTIRKHRLWEVFLVEKLSFGWEEVHEIAEQLEHIKSKELTERLDAFLGFPKYDPHGDPIPDSSGAFPKASELTLSEAIVGQKLQVCGVKDTSTDFLKYVERNKLGLGARLEVIGMESFDKSVQIQIKDNQQLTLSAKVAQNIYVKNA
jgi:DtxR family Mn-dependent transcriptional regulator